MNKELIRTYFEEFKHWLRGGKVLSKYTLFSGWSDCQDEDIWRIPNKNISEVLIVIDDEYVEFRKATAEGKIIQLDEAAKFSDPNRGWVDLSCKSFGSSTHLFPVNYYRIKPERHKFKKGDWVVHNGVVKRVTKAIDGYIDSLDNAVAVIMKEESLELWKPKEKEYFWYENDLVKFDEIKGNGEILLKSARGRSYYVSANFKEYCEPFIGQLPTYIKDSDES